VNVVDVVGYDDASEDQGHVRIRVEDLRKPGDPSLRDSAIVVCESDDRGARRLDSCIAR
jgi:hypothetical protein